MTLRLDEILVLLPDVGLSVRRLDQWPIWEGSPAHWSCVLDDGAGCDNMAHGATAVEAVTASLALAGVVVDDDGKPSAPLGFALAYDMPGEKHNGTCPTCGTRYLDPDI